MDVINAIDSWICGKYPRTNVVKHVSIQQIIIYLPSDIKRIVRKLEKVVKYNEAFSYKIEDDLLYLSYNQNNIVHSNDEAALIKVNNHVYDY
jgi:hypothetical protein